MFKERNTQGSLNSKLKLNRKDMLNKIGNIFKVLKESKKSQNVLDSLSKEEAEILKFMVKDEESSSGTSDTSVDDEDENYDEKREKISDKKELLNFQTKRIKQDTKEKDLYKKNRLALKNETSELWSLAWNSLTYLTNNEDYTPSNFFRNPQIAGELISEICNIYSSCCRHLNIHSSFWKDFSQNYKAEIILNTQSVASASLSVFLREPIYVAFTLVFVTEAIRTEDPWDDYDMSDENIETHSRRSVVFIVNMNTIKTVYERYSKESVVYFTDADSGLIDIGREHAQSQRNNVYEGNKQESKRERYILYKLLLLSVVHAFGHADMFCKDHFCDYEKHGLKSNLFRFSS